MAQRHQRGWLKKEKRAQGETWVLFFRTTRKSDGKRVENKIPIGLVQHLPEAYATPAAFGAAVAAPNRRVVLITGEGSHQLTAQEINQFGRRGLKPILFVLNNLGYMIERLLCKDPDIEYNDLAQWHYADLPKALGCDDWFTARVTTCGEFDQALKTAS